MNQIRIRKKYNLVGSLLKTIIFAAFSALSSSVFGVASRLRRR